MFVVVVLKSELDGSPVVEFDGTHSRLFASYFKFFQDGNQEIDDLWKSFDSDAIGRIDD